MNVQTSARHMVTSKVIKQMVKDLCHEVKNKYKNTQIIDIKIEDITCAIDLACHRLTDVLKNHPYSKYKRLDHRNLKNFYFIEA